jgi:ketosteroid isomerase-like protein
MSRENVEIVRAGIEAFNRGDWDAALKDAAPRCELDMSRAAGPFRGIYELDQIRGIWDELAGAWESFRVEPHEFIEAGEDVIVPWTVEAMGRDGIEVRARLTWTVTIRDGAVERICMYQEREDALQAAGLAE